MHQTRAAFIWLTGKTWSSNKNTRSTRFVPAAALRISYHTLHYEYWTGSLVGWYYYPPPSPFRAYDKVPGRCQLYRWCYYPSPFPFRAYDNAPGRCQLYRFWIKYGAVLHEYSVPGANLQRSVLPTYDHTRLKQKQFTYFDDIEWNFLRILSTSDSTSDFMSARGEGGGSSKDNSKLFVMFSTWKRL